MLVTQVEAYEKEGHDLPSPNPAAALEYFLKSRGLMRT
jgi:antitoxin component HigA of HigAB toxin-antitoxin module